MAMAIVITLIEDIDIINIITSTIHNQDSIIQITNGIDITNGISLKHPIHLLQRMIHILTSKALTTIMMIPEVKLATGVE
jgi:hypothetical protein